MTMLHLKTISNESIMLKKDDIILIKSYGNEKIKIFLRGVNEVLMIDASFEEVKFAALLQIVGGDKLIIPFC
ncbi:hypothetical protein BANRA_04971 [Escherichia coli]|nr:hypothetical protein BANRA_04971 [Escherichia coli]